MCLIHRSKTLISNPIAMGDSSLVLKTCKSSCLPELGTQRDTFNVLQTQPAFFPCEPIHPTFHHAALLPASTKGGSAKSQALHAHLPKPETRHPSGILPPSSSFLSLISVDLTSQIFLETVHSSPCLPSSF